MYNNVGLGLSLNTEGDLAHPGLRARDRARSLASLTVVHLRPPFVFFCVQSPVMFCVFYSPSVSCFTEPFLVYVSYFSLNLVFSCCLVVWLLTFCLVYWIKPFAFHLDSVCSCLDHCLTSHLPCYNISIGKVFDPLERCVLCGKKYSNFVLDPGRHNKQHDLQLRTFLRSSMCANRQRHMLYALNSEPF